MKVFLDTFGFPIKSLAQFDRIIYSAKTDASLAITKYKGEFKKENNYSHKSKIAVTLNETISTALVDLKDMKEYCSDKIKTHSSSEDTFMMDEYMSRNTKIDSIISELNTVYDNSKFIAYEYSEINRRVSIALDRHREIEKISNNHNSVLY